MPAPIVIRNLSPETKKAANPEPGEPLIATKADLRDGSRGAVTTPPSDGGGDPVPAGTDPIDGYPNQWEVAPDWESILTRVGEGTPDNSFNPDTDITYVGAFRLDDGGFDAKVMSYRPPDGTNGPNGSVYYVRFTAAKEYQVPELSTATDKNALPSAPLLQDWVEVLDKAPSGNPNGNNQIGWIREIGGKVYMSTYNGYDMGGNTDNLLICDDPGNLATGNYQGFVHSWDSEHGARYLMDIPAEKQSLFGGTHFAGVCGDINIIGRSSLGHSLLALSPGDIQSADASSPWTTWTHYPPGETTQINHASNNNGGISSYYADILNPPGEWEMTQFGYEAGHFGTAKMKEYLGVPLRDDVEGGWHPNGRTRNTFDGLPLPDPSIRAHTVTYATRCGCAFIPPGSNSVIFLGYNQAAKFGGTYKGLHIEIGPRQSDLGGNDGGYGPNSESDFTNYWWAMNLDDVAGRVNVNDPDYYKAKPWVDSSPFGSSVNRSGSFDPATNRLYLLKYVGGGSYVVAVYQVGSAT